MLKTRNKQIWEEASEWLVELRVGHIDTAAKERLDAWFRESPQHIRAFLELSSIWEEGGDPDLDRDNSIDVLIARARGSTNVIALEGEGVAARESYQGSNHLHRRSSKKPLFESAVLVRVFSWPSMVLASAVLACLAGGLVGLNTYLNSDYVTATGEQRTIHLSDGSTIELNSKSRVRVLFSERERDVDLLEGQALFHVAKNPTRPFLVRASGTTVRAVGTQFDVYRKSSGTTVTVVEGRVAVYSQKSSSQAAPSFTNFLSLNPSLSNIWKRNPTSSMPPSPSDGEGPGMKSLQKTSEASFSSTRDALAAHLPGEVFVSTGEQVTVSDQVVSEPRRADTNAVMAWTKRELVFDMTRLEDVAQEFNRYNAQKLIVSDPELEGFHVTGIFSSTDPASLLRFLRAQQGIQVVEADKEIRISKK
jgi:transmembrane sensor